MTRRTSERALELGAEVIGINNRNLKTFEVDLETTHELCSDIPAGKTIVSESGYGQPRAARRAGSDRRRRRPDRRRCSMRAADPEAAVRQLARNEELTREHLLDER